MKAEDKKSLAIKEALEKWKNIIESKLEVDCAVTECSLCDYARELKVASGYKRHDPIALVAPDLVEDLAKEDIHYVEDIGCGFSCLFCPLTLAGNQCFSFGEESEELRTWEKIDRICDLVTICNTLDTLEESELPKIKELRSLCAEMYENIKAISPEEPKND